MQRYLEDELSSEGTNSEDSLGEEGAEGAELPEWISFGVLTLALAVGIATRPTLGKWLP